LFPYRHGGKETVQALLEHSFCHILFTGGTTVGKEIMKSAAKFLTPVTLDFGGRNAVVVSDKANGSARAKRTTWAKFTNAGQTCLAPNVAIVHEAVYDQYIASIHSVCVCFGSGSPISTEATVKAADSD